MLDKIFKGKQRVFSYSVAGINYSTLIDIPLKKVNMGLCSNKITDSIGIDSIVS